MKNKVRSFPPNDFACGMNLEKIESMYPQKVEDQIQNINDVLEMYNISLYFQNGIRLKKWTDDDFQKYSNYSAAFMPLVYRFFNSISDADFEGIVSSVDIEYLEDFWDLFEYCKLYDKISQEIFLKAIRTDKQPIWNVLEQKITVAKYGETIRAFLLDYPHSVRIILSAQDKNNLKRKTYLPDCLSNKDKDDILLTYVNSKEPNPNALQRIVETDIQISPKTRLAAKRKYDETVRKHFDKNTGISIETTVSFVCNQKQHVILNMEGFNTDLTYSTDWIKGNLDYPTLLNNFIYLFEFSDYKMRINQVSKQTELGVFERISVGSTSGVYRIGAAFKEKETIALLQMCGYQSILQKNEVRLESVLEWFFREYLLREFDASEFRVSMPSEGTSCSEKCNLLVAAMDSIVRQFSLFVQDGEIDFELLQLTSAGIKYKDVPSFIEKKYAYGTGKEFDYAVLLLCSDQSGLSYTERLGSKYNTFIELLSNEQVFICDYPEWDISKIEWLTDQGFLWLDKGGMISIKDVEAVSVLSDLYHNEVISVQSESENLIRKIDALHERGYIRYGSSLLSEPEVSLFNYYLNRAEFRNGLDLSVVVY